MQRHERIASAMRYQGVIWLAVLGLLTLPPTTARRNPGPDMAGAPSTMPWRTDRRSSRRSFGGRPPSISHPQYSGGPGGDLYTHYGSPAITAHNTVLVPVKTGAQGGFMVSAITAGSGDVLWTLDTDYELPSHNWIPPMGIVLTGADLTVAIPGAGGTVIIRTAPDLRRGQVSRLAFLGTANYQKNPGAFNSAIQISTPLTADSDGNLYFGYVSSGEALPGYPNGIPSGLARVTRKGAGSFVAASALCGDASITKVVTNCAPAISWDGKSVYVAVNTSDFSSGYLCRASADATLAPL